MSPLRSAPRSWHCWLIAIGDEATLAPGVLLGLDARAKVLDGLIGLSFSAEVMATLKRGQDETIGTVTIVAQLKIAATVHVAIFLDEDFHLETQFQQAIPLAAVAEVLGPGVALAVLPQAIPL